MFMVSTLKYVPYEDREYLIGINQRQKKRMLQY